MPTCLRASVIYVLTACLPTHQKSANFSFLCANEPIKVPTCHTPCQCFKLACQRVKKCINFSNTPLTKCWRKFLYLIIKKKFNYTWYYIYTYHIHIWCIVHKNCIWLYFYTSCHIKQKCVWSFSFLLFFFLCSLGKAKVNLDLCEINHEINMRLTMTHEN